MTNGTRHAGEIDLLTLALYLGGLRAFAEIGRMRSPLHGPKGRFSAEARIWDAWSA